MFAGTLQEYQKRMKKLDQQYKERLRNAGKPRNILTLCFTTEASTLPCLERIIKILAFLLFRYIWQEGNSGNKVCCKDLLAAETDIFSEISVYG